MIRNGADIVGINDVVTAGGEAVGLHVLGNALRVRGFQLEHHWFHSATHQRRDQNKNHKIKIGHCGNGMFSIWDLRVMKIAFVFLWKWRSNQNDNPQEHAQLKGGEMHNELNYRLCHNFPFSIFVRGHFDPQNVRS